MVRALLFILLLGFFQPAALAEEKIDKEQVLMRYEQAVRYVESMNLYQEDVFEIIPRVRLAGKAILNEQFKEASQVLDEVFVDFEVYRSRNPASIKSQLKFAWLELFFDLFQKFILIFLLAYFFVKWPLFNRMLYSNYFHPFSKVYLTIAFSFVAVLVSMIDLLRYGSSAWGFFDIQTVLVSICALIGGIIPGLVTSIVVGGLRLVVKPDAYLYVAVLVCAGLVGGFGARFIQDYKRPGKKTFLFGTLIGLMHGLIVYTPVIRAMPWVYFLLTILSLMLLEGLAVYLFMAVVGILIRNQNQRELENELLSTRLRFLQAQMSPHFLFNALNTIAAVCGREKAKQAKKLILRLAEFLRRTLKRADERVTLKEEMDYIDAYLEIEAARFQDRIKIKKDFKIKEDEWEVKIPVLILQPLVENAVRHGISKKESGGTIQITLEADEKDVRVTISDDGVGFDKSNVLDSDAKEKGHPGSGLGIGIKNIHERLLRLFGSGYGLKLGSTIGKGTKAVVRIPKKQEGDDD